MALSKRTKAIREKVDATKQYEIEEAFALLKELSTVKFDESVDVAVNLGIDPRKSDQVVRGSSVLPNGTGKRFALRYLHKANKQRLRKLLARTSSVSKI